MARKLDSFESSFDFIMVEPLLSGIVLGLVPVTIIGLFVTAYLQFRRRDQLSISIFVFETIKNLLFYIQI